MTLPRLDSRLEQVTDTIWSVSRTIGFADVILRSGTAWLYNSPQPPPECSSAPSASPCDPRRNPVTDVYAGFAMYTAAAMGIGCMSVTLSTLLRKPDSLSHRAANWQGRELRPPRRGVLTLPRDELGWAANSFRAAILCVGHAIVTYKENQSVSESHGLRLAVGCLAGAGFVVAYAGMRSYFTQTLPEYMQLGRAVKVPKGALMNAITDFKMWNFLHIGAAFTFSGLAAATATSAKNPWDYRYWGSPILTCAGVVSLMTAATLFATTIRLHNRVRYLAARPQLQAPQLSIEEMV